MELVLYPSSGVATVFTTLLPPTDILCFCLGRKAETGGFTAPSSVASPPLAKGFPSLLLVHRAVSRRIQLLYASRGCYESMQPFLTALHFALARPPLVGTRSILSTATWHRLWEECNEATIANNLDRQSWSSSFVVEVYEDSDDFFRYSRPRAWLSCT